MISDLKVFLSSVITIMLWGSSEPMLCLTKSSYHTFLTLVLMIGEIMLNLPIMYIDPNQILGSDHCEPRSQSG